jgi:hypothetical protein
VNRSVFAEYIVGAAHRTFMGTIERGESNLSFWNLVKVAKGLGITLSELLSGLEKRVGRISSDHGSAAGKTASPKHR